MMKLCVLFGILLISSYAGADYCYESVESGCTSTPVSENALLTNCDAKYGAVEALLPELQSYVNSELETSFEYLLLSTHFGTFETNRAGFRSLFKKLSDKAWNDAIDLIQFMTKRGGKMDFNQPPRLRKDLRESSQRRLELSEMHSLAKSLDNQKRLAEEVLGIYTQAQHHAKRDASIAHYLEEKFIEPQADVIRDLSGHTNDLSKLLVKTNRETSSLALFLFDQHLSTIY